MSKKKFKNANWIWYGLNEYDLVNSWMQARKTFNLNSLPEESVIHMTADSYYRLYINGQHICRGPARGFQQSWPYDSVNIAPYLKKGKNVVAAVVHNLGIGTFSYISAGYAGFILAGKAGKINIDTGETWKVREAPGYIRYTTRASLEMGFQEFFNAGLDDEKFIFDDYDDLDWNTPVCRCFGSMPWYKLEPRGIPLLREEWIYPTTIVSQSSGKCSKNYKSSKNIVKLYLSENKEWHNPDVRKKREIDWVSLEIPETGKDRFTAYCIGFRREVTGSLRLKAEGGKGTEIIDTIFCEDVKNLEPEIIYPDRGSFPAFGNRLFLRKGITEHEQFDHWGFRYLILIIRNSTSPLKINLKLNWVGYPLNVKSDFVSSDNRLNKIYEICSWTQQCCMLDAFIDCPWREQTQWWGDARVQAANTFYLSADSDLFKRGLIQIGSQTVPNGLTYSHAPTTSHRCILPDYTLTWIITHWDYYRQTGDLSIFKKMNGTIKKALEYFHKIRAENGLIPFDKRYWLFLDWAPLFKDGYPALYNLLYLKTLTYAGKLFKVCGDKKSEAKYYNRAKELRSSIEKHLWNLQKNEIFGGLSWEGKPVDEESAHVLALAILTDIFPDFQKDFLEKLKKILKGENNVSSAPSPFFMYYVFQALKKHGYYKEIIDCIYRWWGDMVDRGLTTTEEVWKSEAGFHSLCHAWSAHPVVHFSNILLGIRQEDVNWKKISFQPTFTHCDYVKGKTATPHGVISSRWKKTRNRININLHLPGGIEATIKLPGIDIESFFGEGEWEIMF